jgi:hypothetical protein
MQQVEASLQPETLRKWKNSLRPRWLSLGSRTALDPCPAVALWPVSLYLGVTLVPSNGRHFPGDRWTWV